jgi:uncharacterized protein (DUF342 family)
MIKHTNNNMTELTLIKGRFTSKDAETLLTGFVSTKIAFHQTKISLLHDSEENIKHCEKRIKELEENLRSLIKAINSAPNGLIDIDARIEINVTNR